MKSFKEFLTEAYNKASPTYASILPDEESKKNLTSFMDAYKINNRVPSDELHCTVCYSREPIIPPKKIDVPVTGEPKHFSIFKTRDGKNALVLELNSPGAEKIHAKFMDIGASYDFDKYKAHITLSYDYDGELPKELPTKTINFDSYEIKPLDLDWTPSK